MNNINRTCEKDILSLLGSDIDKRMEEDGRKRTLLTPSRVVWETTSSHGYIENSKFLLENRSHQISLQLRDICKFHNNGDISSLLLDFGSELHGGIQISTWGTENDNGAMVRVRFGESVMEAMSELGGISNATNDHATRDMNINLQNLSMISVGETGFRFVRLDLLTPNVTWSIKSIKAVLIYRDIPYLGSFKTNDELINRIWDTGAYTVHLNMQSHIWDGIKRDRLIWIGDLHPEITTIQTVFGNNDLIRESLDFIKNETPLPDWMNRIPSYSMWWIIIQYDYFMHFGNLEYLLKQKMYLTELYYQLSVSIGEDGKDITPETRFIDWPSSENKAAVDSGLQALHVLATQSAMKMFEILKEKDFVESCKKDLLKLSQYQIDCNGSKQAAALTALADLTDSKEMNDQILSINKSQGMSTFLGYYILLARAKAGDITGALDTIREYWGGMIKLGATTFWEDFDIDWMKNAAPIDSFPKEGEVDIHGTYGAYCYKGYRHSLYHGWASGPTPWLTRYILGIEILEPGCKVIKITPNLCDLEWAEGTYPTPYGIIKVKHQKLESGEIDTTIVAPDGIVIIRNT